MTVSCESCRGPIHTKPGSSPCSVHRVNINRRLSCKRFRSTKGASKARRDHINSEIRSMRALLPISVEDQERLSYLHSMSAICTFIRKSIIFREFQANGSSCFLPYEDFLQALPGFIVAMTREGKLIYVSENITEYLGYSMVDVLQGDMFYDMIENADVETVKSSLENRSVLDAEERAFVCRMHTSKAFRLRHGGGCSMLVRGRFDPSTCTNHGPAFIALCTPTANRCLDNNPQCSTDQFQTLHAPDMSFVCVPESVLFHLGYSAQEMIGRSWYSLLHPEDLALSACRHKSLLEADEGSIVEMVLRLQRKDLSWALLYIRATKDSDKHTLSCINNIISEPEATFLKQRIYTHDPAKFTSIIPKLFQQLLSDGCQFHEDGTTKFPKREREDCSIDPQKDTCWISETDVCYLPCSTQAQDCSQQVALISSPMFPATPPYSPASSKSSPPQDCYTDDLFLDACNFAETLLSSPECSPPYLPGHSSLSDLPDPLQTTVDHTFGLSGDAVDPSPDSHSSPSYETPSCPVGAHLVPDSLQEMDTAEPSLDSGFHSDDLWHPALQQEGANPILDFQSASGTSQQSESSMTTDPFISAECHFQYDEREHAEISVLAQQISSLVSSFDTYCSMGLAPGCAQNSTPSGSSVAPCGCPHIASCPVELELLLDENVIDSILQDLEVTTGRRTVPCPGTRRPENSEQASNISLALSTTMLFTTLLEDPSLGSFDSMHSALNSGMTRPGCHNDNNELYQLSQYLHSSLQQDELAEESMY